MRVEEHLSFSSSSSSNIKKSSNNDDENYNKNTITVYNLKNSIQPTPIEEIIQYVMSIEF